jgi:glycosyltransferase involved in cell wall biosynthesis
MRILIFNWRDEANPAAGGAEVFTGELARSWVAQGHQVTLFCAGFPGGQDIDEQGGVEVIRRGGRLTVYREARKFWRSRGSSSFDLVIDEVNTRPFGCPRFVGDVPMAALIYQVAADVWASELPAPIAAIGRYVLEPWWLRSYRSVRTLTISESSRHSLEHFGLEDVVIVPVGLRRPDPMPAASKEARPTCIFLGRLATNKRPGHAIAAFQRAKQAVPDAQLWIVGDGPLRAQLEQTAGEDVTFFGRVDDATKYELLQRADVIVVTSVREGWGMVVTEAASVGTPAIAYDVPGLRDSVGATRGRLVSPNPDALGEALTDALATRAQSLGPPDPTVVVGWDEVAAAVLAAAQLDTSTTVAESLPRE